MEEFLRNTKSKLKLKDCIKYFTISPIEIRQARGQTIKPWKQIIILTTHPKF